MSEKRKLCVFYTLFINMWFQLNILNNFFAKMFTHIIYNVNICVTLFQLCWVKTSRIVFVGTMSTSTVYNKAAVTLPFILPRTLLYVKLVSSMDQKVNKGSAFYGKLVLSVLMSSCVM